MKISLLTDGLFPFVIGGMQKHTLLLAKYWARQGISIDLIYALQPNLKDNGEIDEFLTKKEKKNIEIIRVGQSQGIYFPGHYIWNSYKISKNIAIEVIKRPKSDFIYAQGFTGWQLIQEKQKGLPLPPIGVNFHGLEMYQMAASMKSKLEKMMFRPFVSWSLQNTDYALSLGGGLTDIINEVTGNKFKVIESPNGIDADWLKKSDKTNLDSQSNKPRFVFLGRYERRKGVQELNKAIRYLSEAGRNFHFDVVGPVPEELRLDLPVVAYWGLVREEHKIQSILQDADVLVSPSYSEGMPTVILEAMASGCAIIATRVGAVDALVDDKNGWLINPGNTGQLTIAMQLAIDADGKTLRQKKKVSKERVRNYTWENIARQTLNNIKEAIN